MWKRGFGDLQCDEHPLRVGFCADSHLAELSCPGWQMKRVQIRRAKDPDGGCATLPARPSVTYTKSGAQQSGVIATLTLLAVRPWKKSPTLIYWASVKYTEYCLAYNTCSVKLIVSMGDRQRVLRLPRGYRRILRENIKLRPEKNIVEDLKTCPHLPCSLGKLTCFLPSTEHIGCCPKLMARRPCNSYFNQYSTNLLTTRPSDSRLKSICYKNNCQ